MTETELKPCPFCGGEDFLISEWKDFVSIKCGQCETKVGALDEKTAVKYWNSRPIEDAKDKEIKRLREALEKIKTKLENVPQSGLTIYDGADIYGECCDALTGEEE